MPEFKSITKHFSKFSIIDILKKDDKEKKEPASKNTLKNKIISKDEDLENGKKPRQCFTTLQVEELEDLFKETNYPDTYTRQQLANKMEVSETRIQIWFQNRRAKIRRQKKNHHRRSFPNSDFVCPYPSAIDFMKPPHPASHRFSLPPMDNKSPPPPYHRYSSPPLDNFFLRNIGANSMDHCPSCTTSPMHNHVPYFEHKLLNPACLRVASDSRSRSFSR